MGPDSAKVPNFVRDGSFTVKDYRLYDTNSSSKGRSPAAHIAKTSRAYQLPSSLPKQMIARLADEFIASWRRMSEKCLRDPLGVAHKVVDEVCLITTQNYCYLSENQYYTGRVGL